MLSLSSSSLVRVPPGKNGIEAGFNAALLAMMVQRRSVGQGNVSCAARMSELLGTWVTRKRSSYLWG